MSVHSHSRSRSEVPPQIDYAIDPIAEETFRDLSRRATLEAMNNNNNNSNNDMFQDGMMNGPERNSVFLTVPSNGTPVVKNQGPFNPRTA